MRSIIFCFVLLLSFQLTAQITKRTYLNKQYIKCEKDSAYFYRDGLYDEDTVLHGRAKTYYMTGQLYADTDFHHGVEKGYWTYYYRNGQKAYEGLYLIGGERIVNSWLPNGKPQVVNGTGYFKEFYPHNNYKIREGNLKNGIMDSIWTYWYDNGQQRFVFNYEDGDENIIHVWTAQKKQLVNNGNGLLVWYYTGTVKAMEGNVIDGQRDGKWTIYNKDGSLDEICNYSNGLRHGEYKGWYMNGKIKFQYNFVDGKAVGNHTLWHWNGNKMEEGFYASDEYYVINTWDESGKPMVEKGTGYYRSLFIDGTVDAEGRYNKYKKVGLWKSYYANGKISEEDLFIRGDLYLHSYWDINGNKTMTNGDGTAVSTSIYNHTTFIGEYKNGLANGHFYSFAENGDTIYDSKYVNGEYTGLNREFEDGILKIERDYIGKEDFNFTYYSVATGKKISEGRLTGDLLCLKNSWDKSGNPLVVNGNGIDTEYYPNGDKMRQGTYKGGYMQGVWTEWFSGGKTYSVGKYEKGLLTGEYKRYYDNGLVEFSQVYKIGKPAGAYVSYFENGVIQSKGNNVNGTREGLWTYYQWNGEKEMEEMYKNNVMQYALTYSTLDGAVYHYVSEWPQPLDGYKGLQEIIRKEVRRLPAYTSKDSVGGVVQVILIIEKDGTVSSVEPVGDEMGGYYNNKAVTFVKKHATHWTPGRVNGKAVKTSLFIPVSFDTTASYRHSFDVNIIQNETVSSSDTLVSLKKNSFTIEVDFPEYNNERTVEVYAITDPAVYAQLSDGLPLPYVIHNTEPQQEKASREVSPPVLTVSNTSSVNWVYEDSLSNTFTYAKLNNGDRKCYRQIDSIQVLKGKDGADGKLTYDVKNFPYKDIYLVFAVRESYEYDPVHVEFVRKCVHIKFE